MIRATEKAGKTAIRSESPHGPVPTAADTAVRAEGRAEVAQEADAQAAEEADPAPVATAEAAPAAEAEGVALKVLPEEVRNTY